MYSILLTAHSYLRYFVLIMLIIVSVTSLLGWLNKRNYGDSDNKMSLFLLIGTHLQFVLGLLLYFVSPYVRFGSETMKDAEFRYWTVEHVIMMLIAVALITVARTTSKKIDDPSARHRRVFILNFIALVIIFGAILMSKRGIF